MSYGLHLSGLKHCSIRLHQKLVEGANGSRLFFLSRVRRVFIGVWIAL